MPKVKGTITKKNNSEGRKIQIEYKDKGGKKKILEVFVEDTKVWDYIPPYVHEGEVYYITKDGKNVIKNILFERESLIYGYNSRVGNRIKEYGQIKTILLDRLIITLGIIYFVLIIDQSWHGFIIATALFAIFLLYYLIIVPILILILAIFTFGESVNMLRRKIFKYTVKLPDPNLCDRFKEIITALLKEKAVMEIPNIECLPETVKDFHKELLKLYRTFWNGVALQGFSLVIAGIYLALWKYLNFPIGDLLSLIELISIPLFIFGFLLSMWAGNKRRLLELPSELKYFDKI